MLGIQLIRECIFHHNFHLLLLFWKHFSCPLTMFPISRHLILIVYTTDFVQLSLLECLCEIITYGKYFSLVEYALSKYFAGVGEFFP